MRLVFWGLVAVAFFYGAYSVMVSAYQWFQVSGVVDEQLEPRNLAERSAPRDIKRKILQDVTEAGVPLSDRDVSVVVADRVVTINVIWSYPVIVYQGEPVLAIPLSVTRTRAMAGSAYLPAGLLRASAMSCSTRARSSPGGVTMTNRSQERIAPAVSFFVS
jgi:hypothetical protein